MSVRPRLLVDVDGVVADLVPSFVNWANRRFDLHVSPEHITFHNDMGRSPALRDVDEWLRRNHYPESQGVKRSDSGWGGAFLEFMRTPEVYTRHVMVNFDGWTAVDLLRKRCDVAFVTALMKRANGHIPDKLDWLGRNFPGIPIMTVPSELKHWVQGRYAIDDRWDTCARWLSHGTYAYTLRRPWSELPPGEKGFTWAEIVQDISKELDELEQYDR